ncbi:MAG: hypothetical protein R3257_02860, partial [bacterium]|nr:hypothetical protein [bacterium]
MSGGIKYRLNPIEINNLEAAYPSPEAWRRLMESHGVQVRFRDPETTVQVEELAEGSQYTLILPVDSDSRPENGRLYLHDRYLWDSKKGQLLSRRRAFDEQNKFFPQGPEWLTSHLNDDDFRGPGRYLHIFGKLKKELSSLSPPKTSDPLEKGLALQISENFHRAFTQAFFNAVSERRQLFENIYPITQGAGLTLRFTEPQSGYSIQSNWEEIRVRLIVVIDDPKSTGYRAEQNGRLYLIEDLWYDSQEKNFLRHKRHWLSQGKLNPRMEKALQGLEALTVTTEQALAERQAWKELGESLLIEASMVEAEKETPPKSALPSVLRIEENPWLEERLTQFAQSLLDQVESTLTLNPNQTQQLAWRELLQLNLRGQIPTDKTLSALSKKYSLEPLHYKTMAAWVSLNQGDWDQARRFLSETGRPSIFLRKLEGMVQDLETIYTPATDLAPYSQDTPAHPVGLIFERSEPALLEAIFDPSPILAMGAASTVGGWTQMILGHRFRHLKGGEYLAHGVAMLLEAPTFVATSRGSAGKLPFSFDHASNSTWGQDLGTAYLVFAPLKAAGVLGQGLRGSLANRIWWRHHPGALNFATGATAHSLGLMGLIGGHAAARSPVLGWLPRSPEGPAADLLQDTLLYGHFYLGAGMAHQMFIRPISGPIRYRMEAIEKSRKPVIPPLIKGSDQPAELISELDLGRLNHQLVEQVARIETVWRKEGEGRVQSTLTALLKNDRSIWTLGRTQKGEDVPDIQVGIPGTTSTISRKQGYFSLGGEGKLYYTDTSRYGSQLHTPQGNLSLPPNVRVPLEKGWLLSLGNDQEVTLQIVPEDNLGSLRLNPGELPKTWQSSQRMPQQAIVHPQLKDLMPEEMGPYMEQIRNQPSRGLGFNETR